MGMLINIDLYHQKLNILMVGLWEMNIKEYVIIGKRKMKKYLRIGGPKINNII
jgi:hypothetical protein